MKVDGEREKMVMRQTGMNAMETESGIKALYRIMTMDKDQVMVLEGDIGRMRRMMISAAGTTGEEKLASAGKEEEKAIPMVEIEEVREKAIRYFKKVLSSVLKLPAQKI